LRSMKVAEITYRDDGTIHTLDGMAEESSATSE